MQTATDPAPAPGPAQECIAFPRLERREDQLRAKIQSKMTVATFLAGFAFAALLELIRDERMALSLDELTAFLALLTGEATRQALEPASGDVFTLLAAMSLAIAMILFIGTVYSYDMLIMPFYRWNRVTKTAADGRKESVVVEEKIEPAERVRLDGELVHCLYSLMIRIWDNGFNWAVKFAALGLLFMLCATGAYVMPVIFVAILLFGWLWVRFRVRPPVDMRD
jgi:hypothetical protein